MKFFKSNHIQLNQTKISKAIKASRTDHSGKPFVVEGGITKRPSSRLVQPVGSIVDFNGRQRSTRQSSPNQSKQNPINKVNNATKLGYRTVRVVSSMKKEVDPNSSVSSVQKVEKMVGRRTVRVLSSKKKQSSKCSKGGTYKSNAIENSVLMRSRFGVGGIMMPERTKTTYHVASVKKRQGPDTWDDFKKRK